MNEPPTIRCVGGNETQRSHGTQSHAGDSGGTWLQTQTRITPKPVVSLCMELRPHRKGGRGELGGEGEEVGEVRPVDC